MNSTKDTILSSAFQVLTEKRTGGSNAIRMKETIEEIAPDWLEEANKPFPLFLLSRESFQMVETTDPRGGTLRFLVPTGSNGGTCYFLYKPYYNTDNKEFRAHNQ
jgi:hypothetical protein